MTDITELAQRLKLEVHRAVSNFNPQMNIKTRDLKELVEALEKAQQVDEQLCKLLPPGVEYMDPPDGGDVEPIEQVRRMVADYRQRTAGLESHTVKLPDDAEHDIMAPVAAYLSEKFKWDGSAARWDGRKEYDVLADRVKYALRMVIRRAAGIKWEAE